MKSIEDAIVDGWGWAVKAPVALLDLNSFGNALICDARGRYFRIIPEDLECRFLTEDDDEFESIQGTDDFKTDWAMQPLLRECERVLGSLEEGQCFHLVTPSVLGGSYSVENVRKISITDWLGGAGSLARQIQDCPDGTKIIIKPQ